MGAAVEVLAFGLEGIEQVNEGCNEKDNDGVRDPAGGN